MSIKLILFDALYVLAYLTTATVHVFWNDLVAQAWSLVVFCLSSASSPILLSMLKLHCLVLVSFVLAACFQATSALSLQKTLSKEIAGNHTLNFDDLATWDCFGYIPDAYHHLNFDGLYPFDPHGKCLEGKISPNDLNCAVSAPNALYGARYEIGQRHSLREHLIAHSDVPAIHIDAISCVAFGIEPSFTLHGLKIKPLDIPLSQTTLYLKGYTNETVLQWQVDFPLGYHEMFHVKMEEFSKKRWERLERLEIFADLAYDGRDWEFCLDNIEVEFH